MTSQPLARITPVQRPAAAPLMRRHKAAIIVRFLLSEGADIPLTDLPEELQQDLTQAMGQLRYIDRDTLADVLGEFASELEQVGLAFPDGLAGALETLDGRLSPETAARLRREAGVRQKGDAWARLAALDSDTLLGFFERESLEVSAVLLSKLPTDKAASLLARMPGDQARRVAFAVSRTEQVTPEAVYRIGVSLATQIDQAPPREFVKPPANRLGEILDISNALTRDTVLTGIDQDDADFARALRGVILTFADLRHRLKPLDAPTLVRTVGDEDITAIISGATAEGDIATWEFLLSNMSKRLSDQLRTAARERTTADTSTTEAAMSNVIRTVRQMQSEDTLELLPIPTPED
ncbi:FliG C-terminal domain-containing protein [Donghicola mangrovi]|uniref:Flagellar motor switch protein FliG n=1 Tax=Donghicola mangrovi TaxID=2729614 RepID=A0A850Q7R3_9RHOB|nr:FliG C-terminal domain-containing protein [Donghicola mangrovi]NVO22790.1 flagellar motor switch protein FliG [Donghicola mangrovi]